MGMGVQKAEEQEVTRPPKTTSQSDGVSTPTPLSGKSVFKYDRVRLLIVHTSMKIDKVL